MLYYSPHTQLILISHSPQTQTQTQHTYKHPSSIFARARTSMNKQVPGAHHHNKASKPTHKTKKKAVKVVYISNPMKVNTSASQFRALVQELTGRDADHMPAASSFPQHSNVKTQEQEQVAREEEEVHKEAAIYECVEDEDKLAVASAPHLANDSDLLSLQDINGYFSPSNFWYESAFHVDASKV